jgi:predicted acyl esterase
VRSFQLATMYADVASAAASAIAEDDRRRYIIDKDRLITMADGARICTLIVRPRSGRTRSPALMQFTIYADRISNLSDARRSASNGYAGVTALTRGKGCSPDTVTPYEHDGADSAEVIGWISRQPWSDGRVGMFGGSYNSFAQWATAKHAPPALKALMPSVSNAPGIDTPMEANVFQSFSYDWPFYVTAGKWLNAGSQGDPAHWIDLQKKWYASDKPYRSMDVIDRRPNPIWDRWLRHPSYDAYWQRLIPYRRDFARITIPVLTTDGYLAGQSVGGLYYVANYRRYNPRAESYLVVGPYDHVRGQRGTVSSLGRDLESVAGYPIDAVAHIDIEELRYRWFDYVFKGAPKPGILRDRVNYEVMGANVWKHVPSIDAMHARMVRYHFGTRPNAGRYGLVERQPGAMAGIAHTVNLADRSDVNRVPPVKGLDTYLGIAFESAAFAKPFDLSGLFSGRLDFVANKRDFDFNISLYEVTAKGDYVPITYYQARASYVSDRAHRRLLTPGRRTQLDFVTSRLTSWQVHAGSRLALLLSIVKEPDIQINLGTGKDVSDENVADARVPLRITWFGRSFVDIPASR